jgi:hypothetical protein
MKQYETSPFEGGRGMLHNANTPKKKLKKKSNSIMNQYAISRKKKLKPLDKLTP